MRILVISTAVDKLLLAESTSLASALALVGARLDDLRLSAGITGWDVDQSVVAEEDRALALIAGGVLKAEGETGVIATLVVSPVLGCKLDTLSNNRNRGNWNGNNWCRGCCSGLVLGHDGGKEEHACQCCLHHFVC
jgi:hypothetical protein